MLVNETLISQSKKQGLGQDPPSGPLPAPVFSSFVPLSPFLDSSWGSPPPGSPLFPQYSPESSGAGEWAAHRQDPLFHNLFLSSSCWQAAGEEQKVNEAQCSGITA